VVEMATGMPVYRSIDVPRRSSFMGSNLILSGIVLLSLASVLPALDGKLKLAAITGLLFLAIIYRCVYAIHSLVLVLLLLVLGPVFPLFRIWPFTLLGPVVIYGALAVSIPQLRHSIGWIRLGKINSKAKKLIIATVIVSSLALIGWVILRKPDIAHHLALFPELPFWAYPFAGIGFALLNSVMEEAVFRGIFMEAIDSALGAGYWSVFVQAVPFAALHYIAGFPNGVLGVLMVLIYGVMLGAIRRISKGIFAPVIAHSAADLTIFSILAFVFLRI
jgi:uncharacterized protein